MATRKWAEIKKLSKATQADRAKARAELQAELERPIAPGRTVRQILEQQDELADRFDEFDPSDGRELPVAEYLESRQTLRDDAHRNGLD